MPNDLATRPNQPANLQAFRDFKEIADSLVRSGLLPKGIDTPQKAITLAMCADDMGLPRMFVLMNAGVIGGRPVYEDDIYLALIRYHLGADAIQIPEKRQTKDKAVVICKDPRWSNGRTEEVEFTMAEAQEAGLTEKDKYGNPSMYTKYPKDMLIAKAIKRAAGRHFTDIVAGLYGQAQTPTSPIEVTEAPTEPEPELLVADPTPEPTTLEADWIENEPTEAPTPPPGVDNNGEIVDEPTYQASKDPDPQHPENPSDENGATIKQINTIIRLARTVGKKYPDEALNDMTSAAAGQLITELSREFTQQRKGATA